MAKIRVGIIRCDLHAIYYGCLFQKHDPHLLRKPELGCGGYFYHYTQYNNTKEMTVPKVAGLEIAKVWDADRRRAENLSRIFYGKPEVCDTFEEISDDVDLVFIADCDGDGTDHLALATPGLRKKTPTFVDKPFAYDVKDAVALVKLAKRYGTPLMSLSILREVPHFSRFRDRFQELDEPEFGIVKGGLTTMAGHIHAISLAQHLFGSGVETVSCMGQTPLAYVHLDFGGKADRPHAGVVLNCACGGTPHCAMYASAYSGRGAVHSPAIGDFEFPYGAAKILEKIKKMVRTGKPQACHDEMVECIAIATAARLAQKRGKPVRLTDVHGKKAR
jgi:predicted dehydrogenase